MKKNLFLLAATLLITLGCSHIQKKEAPQVSTSPTLPTIVFYSIEDNYMGFYEIASDSLALAIQNNELYHYYVYDSTRRLIIQGNETCLCPYDDTTTWNFCSLEISVNNPKISSINFYLSNEQEGIELETCSVTDIFGHEYWASSEDKKIKELLPTLIQLLDCLSPAESKIVFYSTDSSQNKIEFYPDTITNLLVRCVNRMERNNPHVILDEEECKYSVSFFPMEDSISKITFFLSSNPGGTDITMNDCLLLLGHDEYDCANVQELRNCTKHIVYPELEGPLMKNFIPENE